VTNGDSTFASSLFAKLAKRPNQLTSTSTFTFTIEVSDLDGATDCATITVNWVPQTVAIFGDPLAVAGTNDTINLTFERFVADDSLLSAPPHGVLCDQLGNCYRVA
jgi:hypothetical protein